MLRGLETNFGGRDSSNTYRVGTDLGADFAQRSDSDFAWSRRGRSVLDAEKQLHDLLATTTTTAPAVRHICPVATTTQQMMKWYISGVWDVPPFTRLNF